MKKLLIILITVFLLPASTGILFAGEKISSDPGRLLQSKTEEALTVLADTNLHSKDKIDTLQLKIKEIIEPLFAFEEMTLRCLGSHARRVSEEELDRLVPLFKRLLENIYLERFTQSLSENPDGFTPPQVKFVDEELRSNFARISTRTLLNYDEEDYDVELNYRLVKRNDTWRIYDLEIEGNSLIQNYRSQFNEILTNRSVDDLIEIIRDRIDRSEKDPGLDDDDPFADLAGENDD